MDAAGPLTIVDDASATYVGAWSSYTGSSYGAGSHYAASGSGTLTATFQFSGLAPGQYKVYATYFAHTNRGTNVPFSINSGGSPSTVVVNQQVAPTADATAGGVNFKLLATVTLMGSTLSVTLTNNANGIVIADAIGIESLGGGTTTGGTTTGGTTTGGTTTGGTTTGGTTASTGSTTSTTGGATGTSTSTTGSTTSSAGTRVILMPGDPGYSAAIASGQYQVLGYGAYVDLPSYDAGGALRTYLPVGYTPPVGAPVPQFNTSWNSNSGLPAAAGDPGIFDTWWAGYENVGVDGLDNDNNGVVDDEIGTVMNTAPPYAGPLRGVQVSIRVYDPVSGTVREVKVQQTLQP